MITESVAAFSAAAFFFQIWVHVFENSLFYLQKNFCYDIFYTDNSILRINDTSSAIARKSDYGTYVF